MSASRKMGGLDCTVIDHQVGASGPDVGVILCHGYGAPGTDLVPLASVIAASLPADVRVRFLFPKAPILMESFGEYDSRAWWELSINSLLTAIESGQIDVLKTVRPDGLDQARTLLGAACEEFLEESGLTWSNSLLGGFSQGAMLTTDLALRLEERPAHLAVLSGTLLNEPEWSTLAGQGSAMKVLQSHGQLDPVLPFAASLWLRDLFAENRHEVEFLDFAGPHTIPEGAIAGLAQRVEATARQKLSD
ncbi:MAG: phospholipase [Planctomycetota bacterium]|nr:phospholipase [Planctomycetota bacterium]